jgi:hypothetical protein
MNSFVGVATYFRYHIPDFSRKPVPLHAMIKQYDRYRKLEWTPEADQAWDSLREAIRNCQTLHFPDPTAPVYLHTDASDYGTGAYLFQVIDGLEICIALLSETLAYRGGVTLVGD